MEDKNKKVKAKKKSKSTNKDLAVKKQKVKFKHKHPKLAIALKIFLVLFILLIVIGAGVVAGLFYGLWGDDFKIDVSQLVMTENSVIVDTDNNIIAELKGDESRKIITLEEMSPYLPKAYIAIEDERYYKHHGVDIKRTAAAILSFITHGGTSTAGGGSTITQQVVKNVTKDDDSSGIKGALRKVKEWVKAYQLEDALSKDQILEIYLNLIYVGGSNPEKHGVEIGAEYYFNKTAKDLSLAQCAFLAGINHSPNRYNPYSDNDVTERIANRTKTVLNQMKKLGSITEDEYNQAVAEVEAGFTFENGVTSGNIYSSHTDALISQLIKQLIDEKQISRDAAETYLQTSGLTIYSTQVSSIQSVMEEEAKKDKYKYSSKTQTAQGAMVVIDQSKGYVVGCIGQLGEKTTSRGQNRATQSLRQTGSSFKPLADIVPGIDTGTITASTMYEDLKTIFNEGTPAQYEPKNYNGFKRKRSIRQAVATSQNIPFIKVMAEVGVEKCIEYLEKMGISTIDEEKDVGLSTAIGGLTYGVSPLEMAAAYATIANNGVYIEPTFYSKVVDSDGKVVLEPNQKSERAFSEDTAYIVKNLLTSVVNGFRGAAGTATYCKISGMDVAAKTGTSNDDYDRWLCGFTNYYTAAAWVGFDQNEDIGKFSVNGSNPAGRLWAGVMSEIHKGLEGSRFEPTANIVTATVCGESGLLATDRCTDTYSEIFIKGYLPNTCDAHQSGSYTICAESNLLANEYCPDYDRITKYSGYVVEKERLGLWDTPGVGTSEQAPTEYCTIHTKPAVVEEPTPEPETPDETPDETSPETPDETPPETPSEEPEEKPDEGNQQEPTEGEEETPTDPETPTEEPETPSESGSGSGDESGGSSETTTGERSRTGENSNKKGN